MQLIAISMSEKCACERLVSINYYSRALILSKRKDSKETRFRFSKESRFDKYFGTSKNFTKNLDSTVFVFSFLKSPDTNLLEVQVVYKNVI